MHDDDDDAPPDVVRMSGSRPSSPQEGEEPEQLTMGEMSLLDGEAFNFLEDDDERSAVADLAWRSATADLDLFFSNVYGYYVERGLPAIVAARITNLVSVGFTVLLSTLLFAFLDWGRLMECKSEATCAPLHHYLDWGPLGQILGVSSADEVPISWPWACLMAVYFLTCSAFWLWNLVSFFPTLRTALEMRRFFRYKLRIDNRQLQTVSWDVVVRRLARLQRSSSHGNRIQLNKLELTAHDVATRIMRKENFLIAMIDHDVLHLPRSPSVAGTVEKLRALARCGCGLPIYRDRSQFEQIETMGHTHVALETPRSSPSAATRRSGGFANRNNRDALQSDISSAADFANRAWSSGTTTPDGSGATTGGNTAMLAEDAEQGAPGDGEATTHRREGVVEQDPRHRRRSLDAVAIGVVTTPPSSPRARSPSRGGLSESRHGGVRSAAMGGREEGRLTDLFLSRHLEWNMQFCIMNHVFNDRFGLKQQFVSEGGRALRRRFIVVGALNLLLSPFLLIFVIVHFLLRNAEEFHSKRNYLGPRDWSPLARWRFREYNELAHRFDARINRSYKPADRYIVQVCTRNLCAASLFTMLISHLLLISLLVLLPIIVPNTFSYYARRTLRLVHGWRSCRRPPSFFND